MQFYDKRLLIAIDKESLEELKKLAKRRKIKVSTLVRLLIYEELKKYRKETSKS